MKWYLMKLEAWGSQRCFCIRLNQMFNSKTIHDWIETLFTNQLVV